MAISLRFVVSLLTASRVSDEDHSEDPERTVVRIPALDGVRALGIVLVLCFHGGISWASGGFLGVDVFFVLSGFLITGLLVAEFRQHRGIALARFWGHRIRRLFPAMLAVLLLVALYAWLLAPPDTLAQLRGDALATLLYVNNWHQIAGSHGYFAALATPRPLLHTWSLSIEEQFYVVWPLVVLAVLRWTRSTRSLLAVTVALALASAATMAVLFHPGVDSARAYYGTDTRMQALLVGAALALVLARPIRGRSGRDASGSLVRDVTMRRAERTAMALAGVLGLVVVGVLAGVVDASSTWPYRGGFLAVAVATATLIASVSLVPDGPAARVLSLRPVRYVGAISYGLYLWHWPLFMILSAQRTGLGGLALFAVRVGASFLVAVASFHLLEMPVRRGRWLRGWRGLVGVVVATALVVSALVAATVTVPVRLPASTGAGLTHDERVALTEAGAFGPHPVRFMLFGDSLALTMAFGLGYHPWTWGITTQFSHPASGCDLDPEDRIIFSGVQQTATDGCTGWRASWAEAIAREHPEVVGLLMGRWEIVDHLHHGVWMHIGQPRWDDHVAAELDAVVGMAQRHGAKVVLFTLPYFDPPAAPDGSVYPEDARGRVDDYNQVLRRVAQHHPAEVSIFDLNAVVDPHGAFLGSAGGQQIREADGVHFTMYAGGWLRPKILPFIGRIGLEARGHAR